MTTEHLHPILENDSSLTALFRVGVLFSRGHVPPGALEALRLGRITALAKPDGGIRGIVVGGVVAKSIAQQIGDQVEKSAAPFQFALKTRAGSECVAHTLRTLSELNEATTILSVDGVGAFDLISRSAMMQGLVDMPDGVKVRLSACSTAPHPSSCGRMRWSGTRPGSPRGCHALEDAARRADPNAVVERERSSRTTAPGSRCFRGSSGPP